MAQIATYIIKHIAVKPVCVCVCVCVSVCVYTSEQGNVKRSITSCPQDCFHNNFEGINQWQN